MRIVTVLSAAAALSACGTTAAPLAGQDDSASVSTDQDCAVIAAVAQEHYKYGPDNPALPLQTVTKDEAGNPWTLRCDWSRYGVAFPRTFDPDAPRAPGERVQWVSFDKPRYDGKGAIVDTGYIVGPLAGMGNECRLRSGIAGWTVTECKGTWIS